MANAGDTKHVTVPLLMELPLEWGKSDTKYMVIRMTSVTKVYMQDAMEVNHNSSLLYLAGFREAILRMMYSKNLKGRKWLSKEKDESALARTVQGGPVLEGLKSRKKTR